MTTNPEHYTDAGDAADRPSQRDQFLDDVIVTAVEGGVGYWSFAQAYRWHRDGDYDTPPEDGVTVELRAIEDGDDPQDWTRVDRALIAAAMERLASGPVHSLHDSIRGRLVGQYVIARDGRWMDGGDYDFDAGDADIIVQVGLFGEVVYG